MGAGIVRSVCIATVIKSEAGLIAQFVEQWCSNPEVVGLNATEVKDFFFAFFCVRSPVSLLGLTLGGKFMGSLSTMTLHCGVDSLIHPLYH